MGVEIKIDLRQRQRQELRLTYMLQQAIKMLPMTRLELVQTIRQELEENPLLEELAESDAEEEAEEEKDDVTLPEPEPAEPESVSQKAEFEEEAQLAGPEQDKNQSDDIEWETYLQEDLYQGGTGEAYENRSSFENVLRKDVSLGEHLMWQLDMAAKTETDRLAGAQIIGNIDDDGYYQGDVAELAKNINIPLDEAERVLRLVQELEPVGVGARDMRECLTLQLKARKPRNPLAEAVVQDHIYQLEDRNFSKIARQLKCTIEELLETVKLIRELNPKPGRQFNPEEIQYIVPDVYVVKIADDYQIFLNDEGIPRLGISPYYKSILATKGGAQGETKEYIKNKFRSAVWLIKSIEQRRQTIRKTATSIVKFQREFLDRGLAHLKPLVLKDVADDIGMHESTISRVTTNKYIHTPQGIFGMKFFFHSGLTSADGDSMSSIRVKDMIKKIVAEEDLKKPATDDKLVALLKENGVVIARRTVTKYRKELRIPPASKRKRLF